MIATTLGQLVEAEPACRTLCALALPPKAAYHLAKLVRLVMVETAHFTETRDRYIREFGTEVIEGNGAFTIGVDHSNWPAFVAQMNELAAVPVEIAWGPVTLEMLGAQPVAAKDLLALGPLFVEALDD
jgi:hypothetical protein